MEKIASSDVVFFCYISFYFMFCVCVCVWCVCAWVRVLATASIPLLCDEDNDDVMVVLVW
jgi:hypothetical protein